MRTPAMKVWNPNQAIRESPEIIVKTSAFATTCLPSMQSAYLPAPPTGVWISGYVHCAYSLFSARISREARICRGNSCHSEVPTTSPKWRLFLNRPHALRGWWRELRSTSPHRSQDGGAEGVRAHAGKKEMGGETDAQHRRLGALAWNDTGHSVTFHWSGRVPGVHPAARSWGSPGFSWVGVGGCALGGRKAVECEHQSCLLLPHVAC